MEHPGLSRFWLLLWLIFGLLMAGLALVQGGIIALALPFLAYLAVAAFNAPGESELRVSRAMNILEKEEPNAEEGMDGRDAERLTLAGSSRALSDAISRTRSIPGPLQVVVTLARAAGDAPVDECVVQDEAPEGLALLSGSPHRLTPLRSGTELTVAYALQPVRGWHHFLGVRVTLREHFNIFERQARLDVRDEVHTLPIFPRLRRVTVRPAATRGFTGPIASRERGTGMIFWGVREYQMGDALQRINWRISSRQLAQSPARQPPSGLAPGWQRLFSNEFEQERTADIGLILDARESVYLRSGDHGLFERSVSAAAALAETFLEDGHRVSLLTYGYGMQRVYPGMGKVHKARILRALAQVEPGSNDALENFRHLPTRLFTPRSQIVMISPLHARDLPAFVRLRSEGYSILLITPDPLDLERQQAAKTRPLEGDTNQEIEQRESLASRLAAVERRLLLDRLSRIGVAVINWPMDKTLEQVMAFEYRRQANNRLSSAFQGGKAAP